MQPSKLLFLVSSYLALFAAAAPLNGRDSSQANELQSLSEEERLQGLHIRELLPEFLNRRDVEEIGLQTFDPLIIDDLDSVPFGVEDSEEHESDLAKRTKTSKKISKTTHTPKPKPSTTSKPSNTSKPKHTSNPTATGAVCEKRRPGGRRRADCELNGLIEKTPAYKKVEQVAQAAGQKLEVGGWYAMIVKSGTLPILGDLHYRIVVVKVVHPRHKPMDVHAHMVELKLVSKGGKKTIFNDIGGAKVESNGKSWNCANERPGQTYSFAGNVKDEYQGFAKVKKAGKDLLLAKGTYNIITNSCLTFVNEMAKEITE